MKTTIFLVIALLLLALCLPASAQHRIGLIGGLNFADFDADVEGVPTEISGRTVFGVGGVVELGLNQIFSLHLEPIYLQKGAVAKDLESGVEFPIKSSFFQVPIFLKAEFGSTVKPYIMAGPTIGYLLTSDIEAEVSGITFKGDLKGVTESIDFGIGFGTGIRYPLGRASIFLGGYYSIGLSNMQKGGTFELSAGPVVEEITWDKEESKYKNRGFRIMAGVTFPLGSR